MGTIGRGTALAATPLGHRSKDTGGFDSCPHRPGLSPAACSLPCRCFKNTALAERRRGVDAASIAGIALVDSTRSGSRPWGTRLVEERRTLGKWWENSHFLFRSLIVAVVTLLPGILILWKTSSISDDVVAATFWSQVATTLISLGVVGVLYESFLKTAFLRDIQQSLGLNAALLGTGLVGALREPDLVRLKQHFGSARTITVFPADPLTWHVQNYPWLLQLARERKVVVRIYLPTAASMSASRTGTVANQSGPDSVEACARTFDEYRSSWDAAAFKPKWSRLECFSYTGVPHGGFVSDGNAAAIFVEDIVGINRHSSGLIYLYRGQNAKGTIEWLTAAIERLDAAQVDGSMADERDANEILPLIGEPMQVTRVETEGEGE